MRTLLGTMLGFFLGTGINYIVSFLVLVVLLGYYSQEDYANFAVAQTVVFWLIPVVQMAMTITAVAWLNRTTEDARVIKQVTELRGFGLLLVVLIQLVLTFVLKPAQVVVMWAYLPLLIANALQLEYYAIARQKAFILARTQVVASLLYGIGVVGVLWLKLPIWWIPLINGIALLFGTAWQWRLLRPLMGSLEWTLSIPRSNPGFLKSSLINTLSNFVQLGYYSIDLVLLDQIGPHLPAVMAQYAAVSRLTQVAVIPIGVVLNTLMPKLTYYHHAGDYYAFKRLFRNYCIFSWSIGILGALSLFLLGSPVLGLISQKDISYAQLIFPFFAFMYFLIGLHSPFSTMLPFAYLERAYLLSNSVAFVTNLVMSLLLIPLWEYKGAATANLLGVLMLTLTSFGLYRHYLQRKEVPHEIR